MNNSKSDRAAMRNTALFVLLAICVILTLLNNWRLEALEAQLGNLQANLSMQLTNISYDMASISDKVRAELEKDASIVSSGGIDILLTNDAVRAEAWVALRELRTGEDVTIVFYMDGVPKAIKATPQEGGRYSAGIDLTPCYTLETVVVLEGGGSTRQETFSTSNARDHTSVYASCFNDSYSLIYDLNYKPKSAGDWAMRLVKEDTGEQYPLQAVEGSTYRIDYDAIGEQFEGFYVLEAALGDSLFRSDPMVIKRLGRDIDYHMGDIQLNLIGWS